MTPVPPTADFFDSLYRTYSSPDATASTDTVVISSRALKPVRPGFKSQIDHLPVGWLWVTFFPHGLFIYSSVKIEILSSLFGKLFKN